MTELKFASAVDSDRFGFAIAKWDDFAAEGPDAVVEKLRAGGIKLVISRVDAGDPSLVRSLHRAGFQYMDSQLGYAMSPRRAAGFDDPFVHGVESAKPQDAETLCPMAVEAFEGFGHYFADERLDRERCREIYADWTARAISDLKVADRTFVVRDGGRAVAFYCVKICEDEGRRFIRGCMGFVGREYHGKGLFRRVLGGSVQWAKEQGIGVERTLVHSTNYPVNAVFTGLGFRITSSQLTYHRWLD